MGSPAAVKPVLVTGATGYIGGRLVPRLLEAGHRVRCLAREPRQLDGRPWVGDPRVEVVATGPVSWSCDTKGERCATSTT
jgi:nucleoside-diphosphate-sugar epimerase